MKQAALLFMLCVFFSFACGALPEALAHPKPVRSLEELAEHIDAHHRAIAEEHPALLTRALAQQHYTETEHDTHVAPLAAR